MVSLNEYIHFIETKYTHIRIVEKEPMKLTHFNQIDWNEKGREINHSLLLTDVIDYLTILILPISILFPS